MQFLPHFLPNCVVSSSSSSSSVVIRVFCLLSSMRVHTFRTPTSRRSTSGAANICHARATSCVMGVSISFCGNVFLLPSSVIFVVFSSTFPFRRVIDKLDESTDIAHLNIKAQHFWNGLCLSRPRDFCVMRHWRCYGDTYIYMEKSVAHEKCPPRAGVVRGEVPGTTKRNNRECLYVCLSVCISVCTEKEIQCMCVRHVCAVFDLQ